MLRLPVLNVDLVTFAHAVLGLDAVADPYPKRAFIGNIRRCRLPASDVYCQDNAGVCGIELRGSVPRCVFLHDGYGGLERRILKIGSTRGAGTHDPGVVAAE